MFACFVWRQWNWLERDRNQLNEYAIDVIPEITSLDMVSGMYNHMALRKTHSCRRNGDSKCRVFHALSLQHRADQLSFSSVHRKMDFIRNPRVVVCNPVLLPLVLHHLRRFRTKVERLQ